MAYKNQNYMTNKKIKELADKNQKGYSAEAVEEPKDNTPSETPNQPDNTPSEIPDNTLSETPNNSLDPDDNPEEE